MININQLLEYYAEWFNDEEALNQGQMTENLKPYTALFDPITINGLKIKNRIVMGPMGNVNMADETGRPSDQMIAYFIERAKGGAGLITSGMTPVSISDDPAYGDKGDVSIFPRIDTHRTTYSGWRSIAEGCHAYGAKFFVQLAPGMGRVGNPECLTKKYKMPISSSWHRNWYIPEIMCRPITDYKINQIIKHTAQVACDLKTLEVDGVYLHGHSGYMIEQMTDSAYNKRKLGKYRKPETFGIELVKAIRKRVGDHYPIYYRIDLSLCLKDTYKDKMNTEKVLKRLKNERTIEQTLVYMEKLVKAGVDMFDVDLGGYENWWLPHPPNGMPPGLYLSIANYVKQYFKENNILSNKNQAVPIVGVGKLGYPDLAENALRNQYCDLVMLARPLLADPEWPKKVYRGDVKSIIPCIGDHEGCLGQLAIGGHPHCSVNPKTAFEYKTTQIKTEKPKKIAVVGAGPSGVTLSTTLSDRGHDVCLYDTHDKAGGMLLTGGIPKVKYDIGNYVNYLNQSLVSRNITLKYNTKATISMLESEKYDIIVTCTGSKSVQPNLEGIDQDHVVSATTFLNTYQNYQNKQNIVVIGGSDVGCEVAHLVSHEMKKPVTIIEMGMHLMPKSCSSNRFHMIHHLTKKGVSIKNASRLQSIHGDHIVIKRNQSKTVTDPSITFTPLIPENVVNPFEKKIKNDWVDEQLAADLIIMATGSKSYDTLYEQLIKEHTAKEIYNIGDSSKVMRVLEAVKAGYALGNAL